MSTTTMAEPMVGADTEAVAVMAQSTSPAASAAVHSTSEQQPAVAIAATAPASAYSARTSQPGMRGRGVRRLAGVRFEQHYDKNWHIAEAGFRELDRNKPIFEPVPNDDEILTRIAEGKRLAQQQQLLLMQSVERSRRLNSYWERES